MMTIKWLIVKEWIKAFIGSVLVLVLLVTVADFVSELLRSTTTFIDIVLHHILTLPKWFNIIFPVSAMIATLFSLNKLQRHGELVAIFACGFSRSSYISLLLQLSAFVGFLLFLSASFLKPYGDSMRKNLLRDGGIHFRDSVRESSGIAGTSVDTGKIWYKSDGYYCAFSAYDKAKKELKEISLFTYDGETHKISKIIHAETAKVNSGKGEPLTWELENGRRYLYLKDKGFPEVSEFSKIDFPLKEKPSQFRGLDANISELNIIRLYEYVQKIQRLGIATNEYLTMIYEKLSYSFICLVFGLYSSQALFTPSRRSSSFGVNVFFVLVCTVMFWFSHSAALALGTGGVLYPFIASFLVPFLFALGLIFYFIRQQKLN